MRKRFEPTRPRGATEIMSMVRVTHMDRDRQTIMAAGFNR